uniref:Metallophosphoesterase n=1 Tax=uncultured Armatimonadetes bacterium TaxID=157466 RepID=A0A6J4HFU6_9BACT|nr:hypothetical protein AVDCRST_MAG63-526 [uncultured Armatimonadetes bacterium]
MARLNRRRLLQRAAAFTGGIAVAPAFVTNLLGARRARAQTAGGGPAPRFAEGTVFHDRNNNGVRDAGEEGIPGVSVSNGREVVRTDRNGRWRLPVDDDTILFVVKPGGWMTPVTGQNLPRFFYIHKPNGSPALKFPGVAPTGPLPASVDFPLRPRKEPDRFRVVLWGDPQPRNQTEIDYIAHDVVEELVGVEAAFGLSLGDILFDDLSLYDSLNGTMAAVGLPWYNVLGNHDMNYDAKDDTHSGETFKRVYGPTYYAFDYGQVHFVVLENVVWHGLPADGERPRANYTAGLGAKQLEWLKNDLALVPKDRLVVVSMHIPLDDKSLPAGERQALFALLQDRRNTFSLSAHTHFQEHRFFTDKDGWRGRTPHHHLNHVTACGSWWSGAPDERGIPHTTMRCGAPNGYSFLNFDGNRYTVEFKAARRPASYQAHIHAPEQVAAADAASAEVLVNVFAGSERSVVEMRLGERGPWVPLARVAREDPYYRALKEAEQGPNPPPGRKLPQIIESPHLWAAKLPADPPRGTHLLQVRTTDMFGKTHTDQRILRVV